MESADAPRVVALAAHAVVDRPLSAAGRASLARAVDRLDEAIARSDAEARAARG